MPNPKEVNPRNFTVKAILFESKDFSIVRGLWGEEKEDRLAMRWNGEGTDPGYPKTFGHPVWFVLPDSLTPVIVRGLIDCPESNKSSLIEIIRSNLIQGQN